MNTSNKFGDISKTKPKLDTSRSHISNVNRHTSLFLNPVLEIT